MVVRDRFQVTDAFCGLVTTAPTKAEATRKAKFHEEDSDCDCQVTVYDVMAHHGRPQEWTTEGKVIAHRP